MSVTETFAYLDRLSGEQQLPFLRAALAEPHAELQLAAYERLVDPAGRNRPDLVVDGFADLLPATRVQLARRATDFVQLAHSKLYSNNESSRHSSYQLLAELAGEDVVERLAPGLVDASQRVRAVVLQALILHLRAFSERCRRTPGASADAALRQSPGWLALEDVLRRFCAHRQTAFVEILVDLGSVAMPLVIDVALGGRDPHLQQALPAALIAASGPGAAEITLRLALSPNAEQRALGLRVLRKRSGPEFGLAFAAALAGLCPERAADLAKMATDVPWHELVLPVIARITPDIAVCVLERCAAAARNAAVRIAVLEAFLAHPDATACSVALRHLGSTSGTDSLGTVIRALSDPSPQMQLAAALAVVELNPANKAALLTPLLGAASAEVRQVAMREVSKVSFARYLERFDQLDAPKQQAAARTLAKVDPLLLERLADEIASLDACRRLKAIRIIEFLGAARDLREPLLEVLHDPDPRVRATAIRIVEYSGSLEGMRILIDALCDPDRRVRANAIEALEQLGNQEFVPLLTPFLEDPDNRVRANAAKALLNLGAQAPHPFVDDARRVLCAMLHHDEEAMRMSAAWALGCVELAGADELIEARMAIEGSRRVLGRLRRALGTAATTQCRAV